MRQTEESDNDAEDARSLNVEVTTQDIWTCTQRSRDWREFIAEALA